MQGIGFDRDRLIEAGIEEAGALAAVTSGDNSNILVARVARENFGIEQVVARIYDPRRAVIYQRLGIMTVATVAWTTDQVLRRLIPEARPAEWTDPTAKVCLVDRTVADGWAGHPLTDVEEATGARIVGDQPDGRGDRSRRPARWPRPATCCTSPPRRPDCADIDAALAGPAEEGTLTCAWSSPVAAASDGSSPSSCTAPVTTSRSSTTTSRVIAQAARSGEPKGVTWFDGDACELATLAAVGVERADVVAAVTGDDEDNLVVSLLAKQEFGVPRVVARVNNPKNEWMFNDLWGVDVAVSTPHLITALVEEAVSVGSFVRLLSFEGGKARLAEVRLAEGSPADGKEIVELGVPRDATVVAVLRADRLIVPRGDTVLRVGDEVVVLVTDESEDDVRALLVAARLSSAERTVAVGAGHGTSV